MEDKRTGQDRTDRDRGVRSGRVLPVVGAELYRLPQIEQVFEGDEGGGGGERGDAVVLDLDSFRARLLQGPVETPRDRERRASVSDGGTSAPKEARMTDPTALQLPSLSPHMTRGVPYDGIDEINRIIEGATVRIGAHTATASAIGSASQALIAVLAPIADSMDPAHLVETALAVSRAFCAPGKSRTRNSVQVAGFAIDYLNGPTRPRAPWHCVGTEVATSEGRVDLVWQHADDGLVMFDEIKATITARTAPEANWLEQCGGYARAGSVLHGDRFVGVRLIPLGSMGAACLIRPDGTLLPLAPTGAAPLRIRRTD